MSIQPRQQAPASDAPGAYAGPEPKAPPTIEERLAGHDRILSALLGHTGLDSRFGETGTLEITNPE